MHVSDARKHRKQPKPLEVSQFDVQFDVFPLEVGHRFGTINVTFLPHIKSEPTPDGTVMTYAYPLSVTYIIKDTDYSIIEGIVNQ